MKHLRILVVHNAYQQRGGEDAVVDAEVELLRSAGHDVHLYLKNNNDIKNKNSLRLLAQTFWSDVTKADLESLFEINKPDVIHVHNTLPLVSPNIFWVAARYKIPIVQTLHNFRLICPQAMLVRNGAVCESCVGKFPIEGIRHACYRGSRVQTAVVAMMNGVHRKIGTFDKKVNHYIALTNFAKNKLVQGGLPFEKITVKPNFVKDPEVDLIPVRSIGAYVGRLSEEKGIANLISALDRIPGGQIQIAGSGPMLTALPPPLLDKYLGEISAEAVLNLMSASLFLVVPSICYEGFPRTVVEAYACSTPVIASRHGSLAEIVEDGVTGLLFEPNDPRDLAEKIKWANNHPVAMSLMGQNARKIYEQKYSAHHNLTCLTDIYRRVMCKSGSVIAS